MTKIAIETVENLADLLACGCETYRDRSAFSCAGKTISYGELEQSSRHFAAYLQSCTDLKPGDRIAVQLPNMIEYPVVVWGALRAGLVLVNTNPLYTPHELKHQYRDSGARGLVVMAELYAGVEPILAETDIKTVITVPMFETGAEPADGVSLLSSALRQGEQLTLRPVDTKASDIALLQYTGGTTGLPKAAMLTHANLLASASLLWQTLDMLEHGGETFVAPLPLYHVYAFVGNIVIGMAFGVHSVLIPDPRNLDAFVEALEAVPFSFFIGINTLFVALCQHPGFCALDFSALKYTLSGGMALSRSAAERWEEVTGSRVYEGYGLTESSAGVIVNSPDDYQLGTIGKPMKGVEVRIVDDAGKELGVDDAGELCLRGAPVMKGYWQQPEATAQALSADGWLHTGDIALIQDDGFIRIVDRKKDLIIVSGFNVYPNEVEAAADLHPQVLECAAIGCEDEKSGELIKLFVVTTEPDVLNEEAVRSHCREHLAAYKVPKQVEFVEALPKSQVGKIIRRELR